MSVENSTPVDNSANTPNTVTDENHDVKYDDVQDALKELANKQEDEERDMIKRQEEKQAKRIARIARLKEKDPPNSIAWCIGDSSGYMAFLQIVCAFVCALSLYCTYIQSLQMEDLMADDDRDCFGPYYVEQGGVLSRCGWPKTNIIIRLIAPGIGFFSGLILFIITVSSGRKLQKSIKAYNKLHFPNEADKGVEYYEIYNTCYFKFIRRIISACAYLQLVSFGLDLARFQIGKAHAVGDIKAISSNDLKYDFRAALIMDLVVAFVLRMSHDSIWIPLKKKVYRCQISMAADTTYTTTTREKEETVVAYIDPNASTVDGNERYTHHHPLSVRSGQFMSGHVPSASHYASSVMSGTGVEYQYAPSVVVHGQPTHSDHVKGSTIIYVNKTATTA